MCDNCPSTTCAPATPKAERRAKHPGNPKVRINRKDLTNLRKFALPGDTDAITVGRALWGALRATALQSRVDTLGQQLDDVTRERDAERATVEAYSDLLRRSEQAASTLAEDRNKAMARLNRYDALAASLVCEVEQDGADTVVTLPGYPEVVGRDKSPAVARLEAAVSAANHLPSVVAEAMREREEERDLANAMKATWVDERQAHAATAAALAACNARVERLTAALATAEANAADSARRIEAQRQMLEERDERLTANAWTIGGLGLAVVIALAGMALVVA